MLRELFYPYTVICLILTGTISDTDANNYCPSSQKDIAQDTLKITADQLTGRLDGNAGLKGKVQLQKGNSRLRANQIRYNSDTQTVRAQGDVQYTSCNITNPDWFIAADQLTLDTDQVMAKNAWFVWNNVPIIYFPRYRMSLNNQRKSGFLTPGFNQNSSRGWGIDAPFYFNLAPNYDAVFTPRWLTRRGLQFDSEYRYLLPFGKGRVQGDWLDDRRYPDDRYAYSFEHDKVSKKTQLRMRYQRVSDKEYIDDFGGSLQSYYDSYLRSYMQLNHVWKGWQINFLSETLQDADKRFNETGRPYERRPSLALQRRFFSSASGEWNFQADLTEFDYRGNEEDKISGLRSDNFLKWQLPWRRPGFHFTPAVNVRYTYYDINRKNNTHFREYPDGILRRTVPSMSLRTGLIFEKNRAKYKHTLEPELYYLYVPYRKQANIPIYDTTEPEFRFNELFRDNRFRGADRIADANQLSVALTHRILHSESGKEILRASLGRIFYFRNNRVALDRLDRTDGSESDIAMEFMFRLNQKLSFNNTYVWDTDIDRASRIINRLSLNAKKNRIINLSHRYRRGGYRQFGINFSLPLLKQWRIFGGWNRDTMNHQDLLTLAGFEYQSCCWKMRLLGQKFLKNLDGDGTLANGNKDYDTSVGIDFSFYSIGNSNSNVPDILEKKISGYSG